MTPGVGHWRGDDGAKKRGEPRSDVTLCAFADAGVCVIGRGLQWVHGPFTHP
jgi:hypothetical protein